MLGLLAVRVGAALRPAAFLSVKVGATVGTEVHDRCRLHGCLQSDDTRVEGEGAADEAKVYSTVAICQLWAQDI